MRHFTPAQLTKHINEPENILTLLDVREPSEFEICHIADSILIPMGQIPEKIDELNKEETIAVICHHGRRSLQIAIYLEQNGFLDLINLTGGIDAWAEEIAPDMTKY